MYIKQASTAAAVFAGLAMPAISEERAISFPNTADGGVLLTADLHTHTVFSDGAVWPSIRVEEAHRDGLDALAITEHLEHQPKAADIPNPDRNRSYDVAVESLVSAGYNGLLIIRGAEVSRNMPPGHVNAVFLEDANALLVKDSIDAFKAAKKQGAFIFWNHPNWIPQAPDGVARITEMHKDLISKGLLHGIEVANGTLDGHSEHALQIALDYNLTVLGTSDIHGLVDWTHNAGHGGHRPMTIVLAEERSEEALKKALFEGKTVAWNYDDLLGREDNVSKLVEACLSLEPSTFGVKTSVLRVDVRNDCPVNFILKNTSEETFQNASDVVRVERNSTIPLQVRMGDEREQVTLVFDVLNTQIGGRKSLSLSLTAPISAEKK
ncbi:Sb-PDE family phosphodiesterase [Hirschia litorea]|uniref:Sb-PDE family phosphodiesterase n=1 Tax=Hirschia litorea TaxID=1199156 RepID=A0ABW2IPH2_9PROT